MQLTVVWFRMVSCSCKSYWA